VAHVEPSAHHPVSGGVVLVVAVGGAAGASLRVALAEVTPAGADFPWNTLLINVTGCALLALLPALDRVRAHPLLPPLLGTGLLGGFTTLSTWSEETHRLASDQRLATAAAYAVGTLALCLGAVALVDRFTTTTQRQVFGEEEGDL
jgi:fluoride exporter